MIFVVDKPRLQKMIALTRDDREPADQGERGPFLRIEASEAGGGALTLAGRRVEATFPATVYEPGVLFLRVTLFRRALSMLDATVLDGRFLTVQVAEDGLHFADTRLGFDVGDMLLYPDPVQAPAVHPGERLSDELADEPRTPWGPLFDQAVQLRKGKQR